MDLNGFVKVFGESCFHCCRNKVEYKENPNLHHWFPFCRIVLQSKTTSPRNADMTSTVAMISAIYVTCMTNLLTSKHEQFHFYTIEKKKKDFRMQFVRKLCLNLSIFYIFIDILHRYITFYISYKIRVIKFSLYMIT